MANITRPMTYIIQFTLRTAIREVTRRFKKMSYRTSAEYKQHKCRFTRDSKDVIYVSKLSKCVDLRILILMR